MEQVHKFPPKTEAITMTAGADITAGQVLIVSGARTVSPSTAASAAAIGTAATNASNGDRVAVLVGGVQRIVAAGAINAGAHVISAASGRVATIGAGTFDQDLGIALTAATNAGDVIEVRVTR